MTEKYEQISAGLPFSRHYTPPPPKKKPSKQKLCPQCGAAYTKNTKTCGDPVCVSKQAAETRRLRQEAEEAQQQKLQEILDKFRIREQQAVYKVRVVEAPFEDVTPEHRIWRHAGWTDPPMGA